MSGSIVWKYFTKCGGNDATCNICLQKVKAGGGTTNLRQHLRKKHPNKFLEKTNKTSTSSETIDPNSLATSPIASPSASSSLSGTPTSSQSRSRSPTPSWNPTRQMTLFENIQRTSAFEKGGKRDIELTNALVYMVCKENLPHAFVDKEGVQHFMKVAVPMYKLPCRKTVTQIVSQKYKSAVELVKSSLYEVVHLSLSADICTLTNSSKGFLVVTAHFLDPKSNQTKLAMLMLGARRLRESHTAENIASEMEALLEFFDIPKSKIIGICTDGAANMVAGVRKLMGEGKNVYCFAHLLNLVITDGLEDINNKSLKDLIEEIKGIVKFARQSNLFMEKLRAEQEREGTAEGNIKLLIQSVPTRWNSIYHMLQRFTQLSPIIAQVLADPSIKNAPRMISGTDIELVSELITILMPFDEATKEISGSEYITGSLVIPLVNIIEGTLNQIQSNHLPAKVLAKKLLDSLKERSIKILQNPLLCHATLSDPRFKKRYMNPVIASKDISNFGKELKQYLSEIGKLSPPRPIEATKTTNLLWSSHDRSVDESGPVDSESSFPNELKLYLQQPLLPRAHDPFSFWNLSRPCMPGLSFIAQNYLCMIISSVASERLVSSLNDVVSDERCRLTDQHIIERIFLNRLNKEYWPIG